MDDSSSFSAKVLSGKLGATGNSFNTGTVFAGGQASAGVVWPPGDAVISGASVIPAQPGAGSGAARCALLISMSRATTGAATERTRGRATRRKCRMIISFSSGACR
jgi:hypothetical protein